MNDLKLLLYLSALHLVCSFALQQQWMLCALSISIYEYCVKFAGCDNCDFN